MTMFARGQCAYASEEIAALAGKHGEEMAALHPSRKHHEVVHRNDLVLL